MIWFLLLVFALVMGYFQVPIWIVYGVLVVMIIFFLIRNPLVFGKDPEKMMAYLKKSKAPHLQFLYHFLQGTYRRRNMRWGISARKKRNKVPN